MSDLVRCKSCGGKKRYLGMGGIHKDCKDCKGIGWKEYSAVEQQILDVIAEAEAKVDEVIAKEEEKIKERKKPGRKPINK